MDTYEVVYLMLSYVVVLKANGRTWPIQKET